MDSKLTLKLNKNIIEKAKEYAASKEKSLSRLIESYLKSLVDTEKDIANESADNVTPFVKSLRIGKSVPNNLDDKNIYREHLERKHK